MFTVHVPPLVLVVKISFNILYACISIVRLIADECQAWSNTYKQVSLEAKPSKYMPPPLSVRAKLVDLMTYEGLHRSSMIGATATASA